MTGSGDGARARYWRRGAVAAFGAVSATLATPAHAATDIAAALSAASPGDVIVVEPGEYGTVILGGESFTPAVTLRFADGANVTKMQMRYLTGVTFENLHLEADVSTNPASENAVYVFAGGDLTFRKSSFAWAKDGDPLNDGTLISMDGVQGARIEMSHFSDAREALIIRSSNDVAVVSSHFTDILEDGIVFSGSTDVLIDQKLCTNFRAAADHNAHPDCIQLQSGGRGVANTNVRISNNTILQGDGDKAAPIFIGSRHIGAPNVGVTVENNLMRQSTPIGIHVGNTNDLIIRGNRVLASLESDDQPRILVRSPAQNVLIENNVAARVNGPPGSVIQNNQAPDE